MWKRSWRSYSIFNNWLGWAWWMHPEGSAGLNNNAPPKWECVLAAVWQHGRVRVRWGGWDEAWWSHTVGDAALRQVSHCLFLWASYGNRDVLRSSPPLQPPPPSTAARLLCHRQGVPPLGTSLHSRSFLLIHLCEIWWDPNVELEKLKTKQLKHL